jgi:diaminopimelate epimerase
MEEPLEFVKLTGSGNDFICVDNRDGRYDQFVASGAAGRMAGQLCRRGVSVGADGVIFVESSDLLPDVLVMARFFEPDGSEAELCGNGAACFVKWVLSRGWAPPGELKFMTTAGVVRGQLRDDGYVRVCVPLPEDVQRDVEVEAGGRSWRVDTIRMGVPHAVVYVDDVSKADVAGIGREIRHHPKFQPRGINVNFVQVHGPGSLSLRTFEFGVEAETLACGTGSAAAAILSAIRHDWPAEYRREDKPVLVTAHSGKVLRVYFELLDDFHVTDVCLETIVDCVYEGKLCQPGDSLPPPLG